MHSFLRIITNYLVDWLRYQAEVSPTIDGLLILDDMIGFLGEKDFREFVLPYFTQIAGCLDVRVKAIHNDCEGLITGRHLRQMGFNLYNFSFNHSITEMRREAGEGVVLLGNIPPRDVLASGTPEQVRRAVTDSLIGLDDRRWVILSCGGGMPQGVPTANIHAICQAARECGG
jgi:uroporphyrinogen-III decarboxylase